MKHRNSVASEAVRKALINFIIFITVSFHYIVPASEKLNKQKTASRFVCALVFSCPFFVKMYGINGLYSLF